MSHHNKGTDLQTGDAVGSELPVASKLPYNSPSLTIFGSVRELTGGASGTVTPDGAAGMTEAPMM